MKIKLKIHNQISKNLQAKGKYNRSIKNVFIKKNAFNYKRLQYYIHVHVCNNYNNSMFTCTIK